MDSSDGRSTERFCGKTAKEIMNECKLTAIRLWYYGCFLLE